MKEDTDFLFLTKISKHFHFCQESDPFFLHICKKPKTQKYMKITQEISKDVLNRIRAR